MNADVSKLPLWAQAIIKNQRGSIDLIAGERNTLQARVESAERERDELRKALERYEHAFTEFDPDKRESRHKMRLAVIEARGVLARTAPATAPKPIDDNSVPVPLQVQQVINEKFFDLLDAPKPRTCGECAKYDLDSQECRHDPDDAFTLPAACNQCDDFHPRPGAKVPPPASGPCGA